MSDATPSISGIQRAAILLLFLGEEDASAVLKHMDSREVQALGTAMASLKGISKEQVEQVLDSFVHSVADQTPLTVGAEDYIRKVLMNAFGEEKANVFMDRILLGRNTEGLEALKWMDNRAVADMIRNEHPQIMAIVLAYLDSEQAADVLGMLPEEIHVDVMMRVAQLDDVQQSAIKELEDLVARQSSGGSSQRSAKVGGEKVAANIINSLDASREEAILASIKESDEELSQRIQDLMFVFESLMDVDDRGIQTLLREVSTDTLALALKGADPAMQEKIYRNMSKRAAQMLAEDLEAKGPVRLSEVEEAQKDILSTARRMAEAGDIILGGGGEEYV